MGSYTTEEWEEKSRLEREEEIEMLARDLLISPEVNSVSDAFVLAQEFYRVRDERVEALKTAKE